MACTSFPTPFNFKNVNPWLEEITLDQEGIESYIADNQDIYRDKTCLHIGTGISSVAIQFHKLFKHIDGIALDPNEVELANNLTIENYTCYLINKHKIEELSVLGNYDVIIDNNIKSYMCCVEHYYDYFNWILDSVASRNGEIITHTLGCNFRQSLGDEEIDSIASRVQYKAYREWEGIVLIKPI